MAFEIVDLTTSPRANAVAMFKDAALPTIVLSSKFDVSPLVGLKKKGFRFNALMLYCILKACRKFDGCYYDIKNDTFIKYDDMCVDMIVEGKDKQLYYVDLPYFDKFLDFYDEYETVRKHCHENYCNRKFVGRDHACMSTSAVINRQFETISVNFFRDFYNPFFAWGKIEKKGLKKHLNISLRVHHACMDGQEVGEIFNEIEKNMHTLAKQIKTELKSK